MSSSPAAPVDLGTVLGLRGKAQTSVLAFVAAVEAGLPVSALDRLSRAIAPGDASFKYRVVSKATLARRRRAKRPQLSPEESGRLARVAQVWALAQEIWQDDDAAHEFLFRPHALLDGRTPIETALGTDLGARLVEGILLGLRHGTAP